jgi:hypothetical protein
MLHAYAGHVGPFAAARLRALLGKADLSELAAATVLELNEADIRAYSAAEKLYRAT